LISCIGEDASYERKTSAHAPQQVTRAIAVLNVRRQRDIAVSSISTMTSSRDSVGCEHRSAPVSGNHPRASSNAGSVRNKSRSSASSYPHAMAWMRAWIMSARV